MKIQILKICFFLLLAVFTLCPCNAGNLLKNGDFSDLTGAKLPRYWTFRGTPLPEIRAKGRLTLGGNAASWMAAIQYLSLKPGTNYTMSWFAAGKAPYSCYIEYTHTVNGRKKIGGLHYTQIKSSEQGSAESFQFTLPEDAVQPYLVFHVKSAEEVSFSKLLLQKTAETADPAELLNNNRFSMLTGKGLPAGWMCRGPADNFHFADDKAEIKGGKTVLIAPLTGLHLPYQGAREIQNICGMVLDGKRQETFQIDSGKMAGCLRERDKIHPSLQDSERDGKNSLAGHSG